MNRNLALALAAGVALGLGWYWRARSGHWGPAISHRELATRVLAAHLAEHHPRAKVLVVGNPFAQRRGQSREIYAFEQASLRGLKEGLKNSSSITVVYPELRPEWHANPGSVYVDPKTTTPLSFLVAEDAFDRLVKAHPECGLIVSLIGLPITLRQAEVWRDSEKPKFALLLPDWRMVGTHGDVRQALKSGKIAAAIVNRPGASSDEAITVADEKAEFDRQFVLVTPENIDQLLQSYPQLF